MRIRCIIAFAALALTGCNTIDPGTQAARMEAQDDATCKGRSDYEQCRRNLMTYRSQVASEERNRPRLSQTLINAGAALNNASPPPPQTVNVQVNCTLGCK